MSCVSGNCYTMCEFGLYTCVALLIFKFTVVMDSVNFRGASATDSIASLKSSPCRKLCKFGSYGFAMEESKINQLSNSPNRYVCVPYSIFVPFF